MNKEDTKSKIIHVAQRLFAQKGYDGTSIRDIAGEADVNVASINYHFKNKENLYWRVFTESHHWLADEIEKLHQKTDSVENLMKEVFQFMLGRSQILRNSFMMMLSDSFPCVVEDVKQELLCHKEMGPPGGESIFAAITEEVGEAVSEKQRMWAVEVLFSHCVHWALLLSATNCKDIYGEHPNFSVESRIESIGLHTRAILHALKTS